MVIFGGFFFAFFLASGAAFVEDFLEAVFAFLGAAFFLATALTDFGVIQTDLSIGPDPKTGSYAHNYTAQKQSIENKDVMSLGITRAIGSCSPGTKE
jgi:hypothetical protein